MAGRARIRLLSDMALARRGLSRACFLKLAVDSGTKFPSVDDIQVDRAGFSAARFLATVNWLPTEHRHKVKRDLPLDQINHLSMQVV